MVTDRANGRSNHIRSAKYEDPLPSNFTDAGKGRFIRLSRIWEKAPAKEGLEPEHIERILNPILDEHGVPASRVTDVMRPLRSLTQAFSRVKLTRVNYLRVERYDSEIQSEDSYNDSVVGIFTRLNTAGRTLSREEITFAWLKVGWTRGRTSGRGATECFKSLLNDLQAENLREAIVLDDVVAGVSFAWAVKNRSGALLSDRDLLKKDIIQPMADDLSASWTVIHDSFCRVATSMKERKIEFRDHFQSLNAFWILCTWRVIAESQLRRFSGASVVEKANYQDEINKALERNLDRWFLCSSWAGRWAKASGQIMAGYANRLAALIRNIESDSTKSLEDAAIWIWEFIDAEIKDLVGDAVAEIERLNADVREQVRNYYSYLWVWHRLEDARWKMSSAPLRESAKKKTSLDVDHIVSVALWQKLPLGEVQPDLEEEDQIDAESAVHGLGNMLLLEKSFNISKGEKPLCDFLDQLGDFKSGNVAYASWAADLALHFDHGRPLGKNRAELTRLFATREALMKQNLVSFAKGQMVRCDI